MKSGLTIKRAVDVIASAGGLVVLSPVLAAVAIGNLRHLGRPILFRQARAGHHGRTFHMIKFRSMTDARDANGELLPDEERLPAWGRFLRSTSLDELPELFNVLIGDMSLVGPRPLHTEYLRYYSSHQARRHEMRPGITGLAQVSGRNHLTWEQKFDLDVEYIDRWSLLLDAEVLLRTVAIVLRRQGVDSEEGTPMQRFRGSPPAEASPAT